MQLLIELVTLLDSCKGKTKQRKQNQMIETARRYNTSEAASHASKLSIVILTYDQYSIWTILIDPIRFNLIQDNQYDNRA